MAKAFCGITVLGDNGLTPNSTKTENYANVRVRLQRVTDAKFFSAWVRSMSDENIVLDIAVTEWFSPGTKFFLTVSGIDSTALFQAEVTQQANGILQLRITSEIKFAKPVEEARKSTIGLRAVINLGEVGIIIGTAEVRYCRQESKDSLRHRVGLRIVSMGRVETTRWLRLSDENAA
jgi:hypothetical protein